MNKLSGYGKKIVLMLFLLSFSCLYFYPIVGFYIGVLTPFLYSWFIIDYVRSKKIISVTSRKKYTFYLISLIGLIIAAYLFFNQTLLFLSSPVSFLIFQYSFIMAFGYIQNQNTKDYIYKSMLVTNIIISLLPLFSLLIEPHSTINLIIGYFGLYVWLYIFSDKMYRPNLVES